MSEQNASAEREAHPIPVGGSPVERELGQAHAEYAAAREALDGGAIPEGYKSAEEAHVVTTDRLHEARDAAMESLGKLVESGHEIETGQTLDADREDRLREIGAQRKALEEQLRATEPAERDRKPERDAREVAPPELPDRGSGHGPGGTGGRQQDRSAPAR